jgi:hypothetical protein
MTDLPILDELGAALELAFERGERAAAGRRHRFPRLRMGLLLPAAAALVLLGCGAAAGTLLVLRGSVIPAPAPEDVQPQMKPLVRTAHVEPLRARDPAGGAPWGVRIARSETGLICTTAGQIVGGRFGVIGLDGRFRELSPEFTDGCGAQRPGHTSLIGARVFYSPADAAVRTVIDGFAGPGLASAVLQPVYGRPRKLAVASDGAFVTVFAGYPEDIGARVVLRFRDGHTEAHNLGRSPLVLQDPYGGNAWSTSAGSFGNAQPVCVGFGSVGRDRTRASGPAICGIPTGSRYYFFTGRRFYPGEHQHGGLFGSYSWGTHPARTMVWGALGKNVNSVSVDGPGGLRRVRILLNHTFLAIYPGSVDPARLTVVLRFAGGRVVRRQGSANLVPYPEPPRRHR